MARAFARADSGPGGSMNTGRMRASVPYAVMLAVSVALYWAAARIDASAAGDGRVGPDFWPRLVIVLMGLLCTAGLLRGLATNAGARGRSDAGEAPGEAAPANPAMLATGTALIIGYVVVVPWLGFFAATAAFLGLFSWAGGFRRPVACAAIGLFGSLALVTVFMRIAYISLPLGEGPLRTLSVALLALLGVR